MSGSKIVVDEVQVLEDIGGGGGSGCDSSDLKQLERLNREVLPLLKQIRWAAELE